MTAAAKKDLVKQALSLPWKERASLMHKLEKSLDEKEEKISKKDWNSAWKTELEKRVEEVESGKVKSVPYAEARKRWNKILGRT